MPRDAATHETAGSEADMSNESKYEATLVCAKCETTLTVYVPSEAWCKCGRSMRSASATSKTTSKKRSI
jgi:uncharacterized OB-fold protein